MGFQKVSYDVLKDNINTQIDWLVKSHHGCSSVVELDHTRRTSVESLIKMIEVLDSSFPITKNMKKKGRSEEQIAKKELLLNAMTLHVRDEIEAEYTKRQVSSKFHTCLGQALGLVDPITGPVKGNEITVRDRYELMTALLDFFRTTMYVEGNPYLGYKEVQPFTEVHQFNREKFMLTLERKVSELQSGAVNECEKAYKIELKAQLAGNKKSEGSYLSSISSMFGGSSVSNTPSINKSNSFIPS